MLRFAFAALCCLIPNAPELPPIDASTDLAKHYAGTLDYKEGAPGQNWTALPEDSWELTGFYYKLRGKLEIDLGPSQVVFGKHEDDKGRRSVVWAVVLPHEGSAEQTLNSSEPGHGNHIESIYLRFHPSLVGKLFPKKTVVGQGDPMSLLAAKRLFAHKINGHWQAENMPVVPWKHAIVMDLETVEGKRRCYMLDTMAKSIKYVEPFAGRPLPGATGRPLSGERSLELFDAAWEAFDREYSMFVIKPRVDWPALADVYRPMAERARNSVEAAGVISLHSPSSKTSTFG